MVTEVTPKKWRAVFLGRLLQSPNISAACRAARISRKTAYVEREADPEFAAAWEEAREMGLDALEDKAIGRAEKESDTLMIFLLKSHRPKVYNQPQRHALGGDPDNPTPIATESNVHFVLPQKHPLPDPGIPPMKGAPDDGDENL